MATWGSRAESRSNSPRYTPVRRRTPVGGFDGRGSGGGSGSGGGGGGGGGPGPRGSASCGVMGSNRQFSPGSGDLIRRATITAPEAPRTAPVFGGFGGFGGAGETPATPAAPAAPAVAAVAAAAGVPAQRSARAKSLNCARETVYERTLRILMTADQDPARWIAAEAAEGGTGGGSGSHGGGYVGGDGGTFSSFATTPGACLGGDHSAPNSDDADLPPPQSNTLLSYFSRAPASQSAADTAMDVEEL
jgi:hypothetical protein